jgi:WD40 repeat protein
MTIATPNNASAITWSHSGKYILANGFNAVSLSGEKGGAVGIWDVSTNALNSRLTNAADKFDYSFANQIAVNPPETLMLISKPYVAGFTRGFVVLYNIPQNMLLQSWEGLYLDDDTAEAQESIQGASFSPDGSKFAIIGSFYIRVMNTSTYEVVSKIPTDARAGTINAGDERLDAVMVWSPDGSKIAWQILDRLSVYDLTSQTATVLSGISGAATPNKGLDWSPDGSTLVYEKDGALYLVDAGTGDLKSKLVIEKDFIETHVNSMYFSPDGSKVAFCASEFVGVWNLTSQELIFSLSIAKPENEFDRYESIVWSPDGRQLAVLYFGNKQILVYNIE